jgi:hypothetical protein
VGQYTTSNSVVVSSGGQVTADSVSVSDNAPSSGNNQILVTGSESAWNTRTTFKLGTLGIGGNSLVVSNGGLVSAGTLSAGYNSPNNTLTVAGGSVVAGTLRIGAFSLAANSLLRMDGGTVTADILQAGNGANSVIEFNAGLLNTHDTAIANGAAFTVGNGVGAAEFHSLGGVHSFAGGFRVRTNALLTGCGTISAPALLDTGATVEAGCGGTLTFTGILTNNGTMRALNGTTLEFYTNVVNNGTIDVIQGQISFHGSFINNGVVLTSGLVPTVTTFRVVGPNVRITFTTVAGKSYTVETNSDLAAGGWTTWTNNIAGSGTPVTLTNFGGASLPRRFYRVKTSN